MDQGITPGEARRRQRAVVDSGNRTRKITGTPTSYGAYAQPVRWPLTVVDVTAAGVDAYLATVRAWARSMNEALKASGNDA